MNPIILIVDDSLTIRMDLAEALEAGGFRSVPCATVAEARAALASMPIALIILDVLLPDGDGVEFLKELRHATVSMPVILLSTEAAVRNRIRGLQTGADEYVGKPYDIAYLVARARELTNRAGGHGADIRRTVLIIDDSATFRDALGATLDAAGFDIVLAGTGEEGLRLAADLRPAAIVVDGVLPGIDGATVIRRIRLDAALRHTPSLLLTASDDEGAEVRALEAGADAFVRKEEDASVVLARILAILRTTRDRDGHAELSSLLGPKRILAVDDSLTYLEALTETLRGEGYDVVSARSGEEALELLAVQPVDCILLDLLMPGLGGQETCRRIKAAPGLRDIPLIMLTALETQEDLIAGLGAGADDYISKTHAFDVLGARVRAQLRRRQSEDENRRYRERILRLEIEATESRAAQALADIRAALIEELERKNHELEEQNHRVREANRLKSEFLANMSHELRTPLNAIIGFTEVLHDGKVGPVSSTQEEYLGDVLTSARHLLQLINDILDLSKVESGKFEFHPEPVRMAHVVNEVQGILRTLAASKRVCLNAEIDDTVQEIVTDQAKLKQVLYNYVSNAIKFVPDHGSVTVRVRPEGDDECRIEVQDTGIGIRQEDFVRLFVEFQQLDTGTTKRYAGTGLGLALTKRIVEAQGGRVGVTSVVGVGSTFFAILPRHAGAHAYAR